MGSLTDKKFSRWGVHEMVIVVDREFRSKATRVYHVTRAVFCVAKAQDTKNAATQRLSALLYLKPL